MTETCGMCGAAATGVWSAYWTGPHYVCDMHAPWRNTAVPLPAGFEYRSLPLFPLLIASGNIRA